MIEIQQIRKMLDYQLTGNDINIIDMIMDYITMDCDGCKNKMLIDDSWEVECNCAASTPLDKCKQDYHFCDDCLITETCFGCENYYCPESVKDGYELRECGDVNCERGFCDTCFNEEMLYCSVCEDYYCCRGVRRTIDSALEYFYTCDECNKKENCEYFGARH